MENLFEAPLAEDIKSRIRRLGENSQRQWGTMTLTETLAHCTAGMQLAMGVINPKRAPFPGNMLGPLIKPLVLRDDKPIRRNSPSVPALFPRRIALCNFEGEHAELIAAIDRFAIQGASCCSQHPHPFFGPLRPQEWAILMYKHLDHHLRQFGV